MSVRDRIMKSPAAVYAYRTKFYIDVGVSQVSWVTGKMPELMSLWWLSEKTGYEISTNGMLGIVVTILCLLTLFGYAWKKLGFYDVEKYTTALKDPVQEELLRAARIIIAREERKWKRRKSR